MNVQTMRCTPLGLTSGSMILVHGVPRKIVSVNHRPDQRTELQLALENRSDWPFVVVLLTDSRIDWVHPARVDDPAPSGERHTPQWSDGPEWDDTDWEMADRHGWNVMECDGHPLWTWQIQGYEDCGVDDTEIQRFVWDTAHLADSLAPTVLLCRRALAFLKHHDRASFDELRRTVGDLVDVEPFPPDGLCPHDGAHLIVVEGGHDRRDRIYKQNGGWFGDPTHPDYSVIGDGDDRVRCPACDAEFAFPSSWRGWVT